MKNRIFSILLFLLLAISSYSQACGIYRVRIIGTVNSKEEKFEKIKIPKIRLLESKKYSEINNEDFLVFKIDDNKIFIETQSSMGTVFRSAETLKKTYAEKNPRFQLILLNNKSELKIEIDWDAVEITEIADSSFGKYFEINLKEIKL